MIVGANIGQYRIIRKIGEGGMGAVYLAEHTLIGRHAAIKVLLPQLSMQREIVDRFFNEARATTAIHDAGIVQVFDFGLHVDGSAYIVMEFLEGEPLDARMKRVGRLPPYDALRITRQCAGSLAAAHGRGIVHRDLKPENIFLVRDQEAQSGERPKILDFGIAKLGGNDPNAMRTRTGAMMGTPIYMSPEQCRGAGLVDHRSDVYSMGCVLFHMITGRPPFEAEGVGEVIAAHLREPPRPPSSVVQGLSGGIDELVMACLAKPLEQRLPTMQDLQRGCEAVMARITASGAQAPTLAIATPVPPGFRSEYPGPGTTAVHLPDPAGVAGSGSRPPTYAHPSQPGTVLLGQPTTLGSAAGQASTGVVAPKRRWGLVALLSLLFVGGGVAAAVVATSRGKGAADAPAASGAAKSLDAAPSRPVATSVDAGVETAVATPDTAAPVAAAADAGVAIVAELVPDAGVAEPRGDDRVKKKTKKKRNGHGKTGSGSASNGDLYGDR